MVYRTSHVVLRFGGKRRGPVQPSGNIILIDNMYRAFILCQALF